MEKKKTMVVLGGGESGVGAAILAKAKGMNVLVSDNGTIKEKYREELDEEGIEWEDGGHSAERIQKTADEVVKSPGIPNNVPLVLELQKIGVRVISEIEFAGRYTNAKMICVTGSNGKTTTTLLTYHILKTAGVNVGLAGNVGKSLARQVAKENHDAYVVELSSFQLDNMYDFKADIAILLNITPDHLDRYDHKMQNYIDAKFRITQNQTEQDAFIYWDEDPIINDELRKRGNDIKAKKYPFCLKKGAGIKAYVDNLQLVIDDNKDLFRMPVEELSLIGEHNRYNSMAAGLSAKLVKSEEYVGRNENTLDRISNEKIRKALGDFTGVEHRIETVATVGGVKWINDSKATNVNSCWYALRSMTSPVVLILGGKDKGNDYNEILPLVKEKVKAIVYLGVDNEKLHNFFDEHVAKTTDARSMAEAVKKCRDFAEKGDVVLLSPCCASFDLFNGYEDRGKQFKDCVRNL